MNLKTTNILILSLLLTFQAFSQENSLVNTYKSPYAKLYPVNLNDAIWTTGFWADEFKVCKHTMVPHMLKMYNDDSLSHGFANFEIAAGLKDGEHIGPPFHDGDFYKLLEAMIVVNSTHPDKDLSNKIDSIIEIIGNTQREDGYIHTPVVIAQNKATDKSEFGERLDFETYNMGHLMTAACIHYRLTKKENLLDIAKKATDFLYKYYQDHPFELAQNAICPSHYMGVTEMYRTTGDKKYYELAKGLIDIRALVKDGTDHNQDRIPFNQQTKAIGHSVRANYLYAGVADVYAETGDDSLFMALDAIWHNLVETKLYITGACGALYDGVSPNGTTYDQPSIQQVHQAYGEDFELPNFSAHNESCANIGNLLWNWRMLQATAEGKYTDELERILYNSLLAGVSLDGKGYFYTNPMAVSQEISNDLRWSKTREEYIAYCNCCPPNTIRTIAEIQNYIYNISEKGLYVNLYGANNLDTKLKNGSALKLSQQTDYPWDGNIKINIEKAQKNEFSIFLRIPAWCSDATLTINNKAVNTETAAGTYAEINRKWKKGDVIELLLPMPVKLIQTNPLVEENRNQVAVQRGPVVYCIESVDLPKGKSIFDISIPKDIKFQTKEETIDGSRIISLEGYALLTNTKSWENTLYQEIDNKEPVKVPIKLIPYYAWGNRTEGDMSIWLPLAQ